MTEGARRYVPVADTMETEEELGLCREICRDMVPNWDTGAGPSPGPGATAGPEFGMEGVGTAMGMPIPLLPLFSLLPLPPLLPLCVRCLWFSDAVRPGLFCWPCCILAGLVM